VKEDKEMSGIRAKLGWLRRRPKQLTNDYKNSSGNLRKTFLNIKDEYPPLDNFKKFTNLKIYGYDNDKSIPLKLLQKNRYRSNILYPVDTDFCIYSAISLIASTVLLY